MENVISKITIYLLSILIILSNTFQVALATDHLETGDNSYSGYVEPSAVDVKYDETGDAEDEIIEGDSQQTESQDTQTSKKDDDNKIIFNPYDMQIIDRMLTVFNSLPELEADIEELSRLTSTPVEELDKLMQERGYEEFKKIANDAEKKYFNQDYIRQRLLSSPDILFKLLGLSSESAAIQELANNRKGVEEEIDRILEYQIDKKIVDMLAYLVRPKDDPRGGAGHWKIKVSRLFGNFGNEKNNKSNESIAVLKDNEQAKKSADTEEESETIESVKADENIASLEQTAEEIGLDNTNSMAAGEILDQNGNTVSDFLINLEEPTTNISSHYKGMAVDIMALDDIRCTKIEKKRIGSDKKTVQAPQDIKFLWQTTEGYAEDKNSIDSSYNKMMMNMSQDALLDMLSGMNIDMSNIDTLEVSNFSDIAAIVGQAFFANALNTSSEDIWKFDLGTTIQNIGAIIIADSLKLDRRPFLDSSLLSIDSITEGIGRAGVETRMGLTYGSLKGSNREDMLINVGKARILHELGLPADTLDGVETANQHNLLLRIGSRIFEEELGLIKDSLYTSPGYHAMSEANGKYRVEGMFMIHKTIDTRFNIPSGSSRNFKNGSLSTAEYAKRIALSQIMDVAYKYANYGQGSDPSQTPTAYTSNNLQLINWRDEMFNLPEGTIDKFLRGELNNDNFKEIGIYSLSRIFENSDLGRSNFSAWLRNPSQNFIVAGQIQVIKNQPFNSQISPAEDIDLSQSNIETINGNVTLAADTYASIMGISNEEVYSILGSDKPAQTTGVFKRLGERIFVQALKTSSVVKEQQNEFLRDHPDLEDSINTYEFYITRYQTIREHLNELKEIGKALKDSVNKLDSAFLSESDKQVVIQGLEIMENDPGDTSGREIEQYIELSRKIIENSHMANRSVTILNDSMQRNINYTVADFRSKVNAYNYEVEIIAKNAYEIMTGTAQNDFRLEDVELKNLESKIISLGGVSVSGMDLAMFLSGKIKPEELLMSIGSAKLADELNLPPRALKYAAKLIRKSVGKTTDPKLAFYKAIGLSALETKLEQEDRSWGSRVDIEDLADTSDIESFRDKLAVRLDNNKSKANAVIAEALGLKGYNLEYLMNGDFGAWASARQKSEANDKDLGVPTGTTENFIKGTPLQSAASIAINDDDYRQMATKMNISEASLRLFVSILNGQENPAVNEIYFVDRNRYIETNDTDSVCGGKVVPDNVFMYYDQDGMHYFNSYPEANEYVKSHKDRKINYLDDIVRGFTNVASKEPLAIDLSDEQKKEIRKSLEEFMAGQRNSVLSPITVESQSIFGISLPALDAKADISVELFNKFFSHSKNEDSGDKLSVDLLKTTGIALLKNFGVSYLGQSIGMNIGSGRINTDDIYEIMNGNSKEIFSRIGGTLLDQQMGLERGTFEEILTASTTSSRKCALERASAQILGNVLDIDGLNLSGSLFNNIGGSKIEQLLGFPEGSFRGKNISELIDPNRRNYIPIIDFYSAFRIPIDYKSQVMANNALMGMGKDYYNRYKDTEFQDKVKVINNYVEAIGEEQLKDNNILLWAASRATNNYLKSNLENFLKVYAEKNGNAINIGLVLLETDNYSSYSSKEFLEMMRNFETRLTTIDSALNLVNGQTIDLLLDRISPDNYRKKVSDLAIAGIGLDMVKQAFGIESEITIADINRFKQALSGDLTSEYQSGLNYSLSEIYSFFNKLFSLKLDEKAGFDAGTIASLIAEPAKAESILAIEGAKKLDFALGIKDKGINFSSFVQIYTDNDPEKIKITCSQTTDPDRCLNDERVRTKADQRIMVEDIVANHISDFLTDISGVEVEVTQTSPFGQTSTSYQKQHGITLSKEHIKDVFKGDLRIFGVFAAIRGLSSVLGDENGRYTLGQNSEGFLFNPQDIVWAFYGDPQTEEYAAQRAREQVYAQANATSENIDTALTESSNSDTTTNNIPLSAASAFHENPIATMTDSRQATIEYANLNYNKPENADVNPPVDPSIDDFTDPAGNVDWEGYDAIVNRNITIKTDADQAATQAVAQDRKLKRELFEYRVADCMLRKVDKRIPAGFSWSMLKGNSYVRSVTLLNYIENWLRQDPDGGWATYLPSGSLGSIYDYFKGPYRGDLDRLINNTTGNILNMMDEYLMLHSPNTFGITLAPGTAQGLLAFVKTGNINDTVSVAGQEFSLSSVYKNYTSVTIGEHIGGWADKKLGLPQGASYQIYASLKDFQTAKFLSRSLKEGMILTKGQAELLELPEGTKLGTNEVIGTNAKGEPIKGDSLKTAKSNANQRMTDIKASLVTMAITALFSNQIADMEESIGLVPGTGTILVGMAVGWLMGASFNPIGAAIFVVMNLFGVYKVEMICTADGYYPAKEAKLDATKWDNAGLGTFNALNAKVREKKYIEAAQYKTNRLAIDLFEMPTRTGDKDLVPLQVMTGREESVSLAKPLVLDSLCKEKFSISQFIMGNNDLETAVCSGTKVGIWQNPQTVSYTHIGF